MTEIELSAVEVDSKDEIPFGGDRVVFNPGHTDELLKTGLITRDYLYVVRDSRSKHPYSSVPVEALLSNSKVKENSIVTAEDNSEGIVAKLVNGHLAQDVLVRVLNEESNSDDSFNFFLDLEEGGVPVEFLQKKIKNFDVALKREHTRAIASLQVLKSLPYQKSEARSQLEKRSESKLSVSLEEKVRIVEAVKRKLGLE